MNRSAAATVLTAAVLVLAGCGGNSTNSNAPASSPASSTAPAAGAPITGCTETPTEELFVRTLYACDTRATNVYVFDSNDARDNWWKVAESAGTVKDGQGDKWMEVKQ